MDITSAQREAIVAAINGGNKIEAIKLCREATGMGLAEAKDWVERLESSPDAPLPTSDALTGDLAPVADFLFAGRKIDAIRHYREHVKPGTGLKESKEAVDQLEAGLRAQHPEKFSAKAKSGCAAVLAVLAVIIVLLAWVRF